jgi:hypothetical protein
MRFASKNNNKVEAATLISKKVELMLPINSLANQ